MRSPEDGFIQELHHNPVMPTARMRFTVGLCICELHVLTWPCSAGDEGGILVAQLVEEVGSIFEIGRKLIEEDAAEECGRAQSWVLRKGDHRFTIICIRQSR